MPQEGSPTSFLSAALGEIRCIAPDSGALIGLASVLTASCDYLAWLHRPNLQGTDYILGVATILAWAFAAYHAAMRMMPTPMTIQSAAKFFGTSVALAVPAVLSLGALYFAAKSKEWPALLASLPLVLLALLAPAVLAGWPVLQASSTTFVGPIEAFKATKGFRWELILASVVGGALSHAAPETSEAVGDLHAVTYSAANGAIAALSAVYGLAVAVSASRSMRAANPA